MDRKITALKAQKKNNNRVSVYLDGEYAFGLARIVAAWLHVGLVLTEEKVSELQMQDTCEVAYQKALKFISYRPRSETEVSRKLASHGFDDMVWMAVLGRLRKNGLVGDENFARTWVDNRNTFRPRSRRALSVELRQKGIEEDTVQSVLDEMVDDEVLALRVAERWSRRLEGLEWNEFRKRLAAYLARRGFNYATIAPIVQKIWEEQQMDVSMKLELENEELNNEPSIK